MTTTTPHVYGAGAGAIGSAMSTEPTERARRETWADWWPDEPTDPEHLLTRQELAERAQAAGIAITERDIANWQSLGMLPRGIGRRAGRTLQMLYPPRYLDLLRDAREEQQQGTRRAAIGLLLRTKYAGKTRTAPQSAVISVPAATAIATAITPTVTVSARGHVRRGDPALTADDELARTLRRYARAYEAEYGGHIVRAELRLIDDHGNPLTLAVDTD